MSGYGVVEVGGMIFDPASPDCFVDVVQGQGSDLFAFIQCVDVRTGHKHRYWGSFCWLDPDLCIAGIMRKGGKWPVLRAES